VRHFPGAFLVSKDGGDPNCDGGELLRSADPRPKVFDFDDVSQIVAMTVDTFSNPTTSPSR
jgi:hypothetical protein